MTTMAWDAQPVLRPARATAMSRPSSVPVARPAPMRLTRRGRLAVSLVAGAVAMTVGLAAQSADAEGPRTAVEVQTRTVAAGETLWEIAASVATPGQDVRDVVADLSDLNGLLGGGLQAGQQLLVPAP